MKKVVWYGVLLVLLGGCLDRIPYYSPRRNATPEHRAASTNQDCIGCHDPKLLKKHSPEDDCLHCHSLCRGC